MISEVKKNEITYADSPTKFEAGTMQTAEVVAFAKSIKFIQDLGIKNMILFSRSKKKIIGLEGFGLKIKRQVIIR